MNLAHDAQLVHQIQQVTQGGSRLLVSLARRGKALKQKEPQRAVFLLAAVGTHPLYKGGRLAFDMMEIEDLILDNPLVDPMSTDELTQVLTSRPLHLAERLRQMAFRSQERSMPVEIPLSHNDVLGGTLHASVPNASDITATPTLPRVSLGPRDDVKRAAGASTTLDEGRTEKNTYPELRSSDYLYDYVVLGFLDVVGGIIGSSGVEDGVSGADSAESAASG